MEKGEPGLRGEPADVGLTNPITLHFV